MIQDITPHAFSNSFKPRPPRAGDYILVYGAAKAYMRKCGATADGAAAGGAVVGGAGGSGAAAGGAVVSGAVASSAGGSGAVASGAAAVETVFPRYEQIGDIAPGRESDLVYLFDIDDAAFYYLDAGKLNESELKNLIESPAAAFRTYGVKWLAFAGITASHLSGWYERHRICGRCGARTRHSKIERMIECPDCGEMYYPRISPAVIVGVTDGSRLLLTRYANRPGVNYALIAGFCEIGEPIEDTVRREVMEEVGVRVKNIRFYKSQPWGFSSSLLMGFYCDLDGSAEITLDHNELATAEWVERENISVTDTSISLTSEMIETFRLNLPGEGLTLSH